MLPSNETIYFYFNYILGAHLQMEKQVTSGVYCRYVDFGLISVSDVAVACRSCKAWSSWCWTIILDRLFHFIIRVVPGIYAQEKQKNF